MREFTNLGSLRVSLGPERRKCDTGISSCSTRAVLCQNTRLRNLSLHLSRRISTVRSKGEKQNALARLCPVLSQIRSLQLEGDFGIPKALWISLDTERLHSLCICSINIIHAISENLVGILPSLRTLKLSCYPTLQPKQARDEEELLYLLDFNLYEQTKIALSRFLAAVRITSLTLCHFDWDMVQRACQVTGTTLRDLCFHQDFTPLLLSSSLEGSQLTRSTCGADGSGWSDQADFLPHLEHLGVDIRMMNNPHLHPGGYWMNYIPPPPPPSTIQIKIPPPPLPPWPMDHTSAAKEGADEAQRPSILPPIPLVASMQPYMRYELMDCFQKFNRLKHVSLATSSPHARDVNPEDCVRAFCHVRGQKSGVPLESLEVASQVGWCRVWEDGQKECILTYQDRLRGYEQIWNIDTLTIIEEKDGAQRPPKPWGATCYY